MVYSYIWIIINVNLDNNLTKLIFEFKKDKTGGFYNGNKIACS